MDKGDREATCTVATFSCHQKLALISYPTFLFFLLAQGQMAAADEIDIIVGIHGVGTPPAGEVAQSICEGYTRAHANDEITTRSLLLADFDPQGHVYRGIEVQRKSKIIQIWEVNWSDLKGFPLGKIGAALYALKAVAAMMQISDEGWHPDRAGITGKLIFGALLRRYFCAFSLVTPLIMLAIAFAFVQDNLIIALTLLGALAVSAFIALLLLLKVDPWFGSSFPVLVFGIGAAIWMMTIDQSNAEHSLHYLIPIIGASESLIGLLAFLTIVELLVRRTHTKRSKCDGLNTWTIFIARAGMVIVAVTTGVAIYTSVVNAIAFFLLDKLISIHAVNKVKYGRFENLYLDHIGYNLAHMELINWLTTFSIGTFLVAGIGYQFARISISNPNSATPRGRYIQNILNSFLWLSLVGFVVVFAAYFADRWLCSRGRTDISPLHIYAASATRIVPFLLPIFISSLSVGLNVIADVFLYILPADFPFSIQVNARNRLNVLLTFLRTQYPEKTISLLAHSQGTVVARDVLQTTHVPRFVTVGSPLASLYERFLGEPVTPISKCHWVNMYRPSDYIAGPLKQQNIKEVEVGTNYGANHIHYFDDAEVILCAEGSG